MEARGEINVSRRHLFSDDKPESPNLRDYLRIRQDENFNGHDGRANSSGRTLSAVLKTEDRNGELLRSQSNRTLLDVIREDPTGGGNTKDGKRSWKHFREKLRLRRQGSGNAWTSSVPVPASDVPLQPSSSRNRMTMMTRRDSTRMNMPVPDGSAQPDVDLSMGVPRSRSAMLQRESRAMLQRESRAMLQRETMDDDDAEDEAERERVEDEETEEEGVGETGEEGGGGGGDGQPERMSLMDLLAETDGQMGLMMDEDDDDDEDEGSVGAGGYNNCCVCMVRHKGAAFIPCGHTFCRLCSRELWVQRGNCPLCNNFILEILDIF